MTDETTIRLLGFAGSLRSASYNRGLLRAAVELAPPGVEIESFDLRSIPLFDEDVEAEGDPEPVVAFKRAIGSAEGLVLACPEYNHGITGVLKNAIDWASRPPGEPSIGGKLVALMGATPGGFGTVRSQIQVRQALLGAGARPLDRPQLHVARARERFDDAGNLVDDETREKVEALVAALVQRVRAARA